MAIITDNAKLNNFINYMDTISDSVVKGTLYTDAIEAFTTGLKDFSINEQERSVSFAEFMAKTYLGQLEIISRTALSFDGEMAKVDLIDQQKLTEVQNTAKVQYEAEHILPSQNAVLEKQDDEIQAKINLIDQQKLTEVQNTAKVQYEAEHILPSQNAVLEKQDDEIQAKINLMSQQKLTEENNTRLVEAQADALPYFEAAKLLKTKKEVSLVGETTVLTMEQINSERLRQQDTKANIALKNHQTLTTWESARTEESRRLVLLKANNDNLKIKQSEHLVNYFKVVSDDEDVTITADSLHTAIKTNIEALDDNAIAITATLPSGSSYTGDTEPTGVSSTITVRTEEDVLVVP